MIAFLIMEYESDIQLNPALARTVKLGGVQQIYFIPIILGALGGLASGAGALATGVVSAGAGAVGALTTGATSLAGTAIGAGGSVLSGVGSLASNVWQTGAGVVSGVGSLFGGGANPSLTIGEQMALEADPWYYGGTETAGGLFSNLSLDTIGNVAGLGFSLYQSAEQRKLAEKAIEAQRRSGYVVGAPGTTALAPTTSVAIPAAAAAQKQLDTKMITYLAIGLIAFLIFKGKK